jgi:peptidoglycan/LPS O-acetylase OafA/YrhL
MRFAVLDSLRGVCALAVVLFHVEVIGQIYAGHLHDVNLVRHAFFFVDFFFVLSGFVVAHGYFLKIGSTKDIASFMIRRFGRIYPLHILVLAAFIVLELIKAYLVGHGARADHPPFEENYSIESIFTNILLIQALDIHDRGTWNSPSWSISVEFYTYVIFSVFAYCFGRTKPVLPITVAAILATVSAITVYSLSKYYIDTIYDYAIFRCIYGFFGGVVAFFLFKRFLVNRAGGFWLNTALEMTISIVAVFSIEDIGVQPGSILVPVIFIGLVLVFSGEQGLLSRIFMTRPFKIVGAMSYTIYITHAFIIILAARCLKTLSGMNLIGISSVQTVDYHNDKVLLLFLRTDIYSDAFVAFVVLSVLIVSAVLHRYFEEPSRVYFKHLAEMVEGGLGVVRRTIPSSDARRKIES